jgi:hypothetical protein
MLAKWRFMVDNDLVIIPSRDDHAYDEMTEASVELTRKSSGTLFRKHILNVGKDLIHPAVGKIKIDEDFVSKLKTNFDNKACDIVQVPKANAKNQHVEDPDSNVGEVVDIEVKDDKVYAVIDARDPKAVEKFKNKTYIGASAMIAMNYTDTNTGKKVGPTLCHVAVTNRPYITNLEDYEEIVKASADTSEEAVLLTEPATEEVDNKSGSENEPEVEEQKPMTKEELIKALKDEHGVDVDALQAEAAKPAETTDTTELSNTLVKALTEAGVVKLSQDGTDNAQEVVNAVVELANDNVKLSKRIDTLELSNAEILATAEVDSKVRDGFIEPAKKPAMIKLYLSNKELYDELLPAEPVVELSAERGDSTASEEKEDFDPAAEAERLVKLV